MGRNKTLKKITKKATKLNPVSRQPAWKRALPMSGSLAAGAAGSFVLNKVARKAASLVGQGQGAAGNIQEMKDKVTSAADAASEKKTPFGAIGAIADKLGSDSNGSDSTANTKLRHIIKEEIDVAVPRKVAYNQWTQFEEFSKIFKGVQSAEQDADEKVRWSSKIGPSDRQWTTKITEQIPDERIAWKSTGGSQNKGVVSFHSLDDNLTHVMVEMEYHPQGTVEKFGNLMRIQRRRVRRDLRLFKHFLELRGEETGEWRGKIQNGAPDSPEEGDGQNSDDKESQEAG